MQIILLFLAILLEGFSVIAGIYYIKRRPDDLSNKLFTYFLLFTFCVEVIAIIPAIIYHHEALHYLKDTLWYTNFWLFNPYLILSFSFYCFYFGIGLKSKLLKNILNWLVIIFVASSIFNLLLSDVYLISYSYFTVFIGVALMFLSISFYYYELMLDEKFLDLRKSLKFYVSVAFLIFNLISLPLWIYFKYFNNALNPEFVKIYQLIFYFANVVLYSTYIFAFIYCAKNYREEGLSTNSTISH